MAESITDVREIARIACGFMASKALFCALDPDLFTRLSRSLNPWKAFPKLSE